MFWKVSIAIAILIQVFGVGFIFAMSPFQKKFGTLLPWFFFISEIFFMTDMMVQTLKIPSKMTDPTFKKTVKIYFKKRFALDLIATVISDGLFLTLFL